MKNIAIIGPESSGKSTLANGLSEYFKGVCLEEQARNYLQNINRDYVFDDVEKIAQLQWESIQKHKDVPQWVFCDTELWVIELWTQIVFQRSIPWVKGNVTKQPFDLFLLCYPDLLWEPDPLREAPKQSTRIEYFNWFEGQMIENRLPYFVVKGENRLENAIRYISEL